MENKNTIQKAIDYLGIYATKSEKFEDFKFIGKSTDNPLKVSYISQKKIDSLLEYTDTKILGTKMQREKYFTSTSIQKLLQQMFVDESFRTENISIDIDTQLRKDFCKDSQLFIEEDLIGYYSQKLDKYVYNKNGSCMEGKPPSYFKIYDNFINVSSKIVGLKVGKSVVARAILWTKTNPETQENQYFLDRIYISAEFQNSNQSDLQNKLYNKIKRALKLKRLDCYSMHHIKKIHETDKLNYFNSSQFPPFSIQISKENFQEIENYPYLDTFRYGTLRSQNINFEENENGCDIILEDTCGNYTDADANECDCCGDRVHEDETRYSDLEDEQLCEDCCIYIDERDDYCRTENATYNNYSGNYHYQSDLDY